MPNRHVPVLVVGGSLVGLSTALFLAQHGVECLLVERHPGTSVHPRAVGYHPRTGELLRAAGIEDDVAKAASGFAAHRTRAGVRSLAGPVLFSREEAEDTEALDALTPCRLLLLTQDRLEPILRARAEALGAHLRFGTRLTSFTAGDDGIDARLVDEATGEPTEVRADYLIGADGPGSFVRETLGIARTGAGVLSHHVSIAFQADLREPLAGRRFSVVHVQNDEVTGILVHDDTVQEGTLIVGYDPDAGQSMADFTDDRCRRLVSAAIGAPDLPVHVRSRFPWQMAALTAERYRHGRVLIAGDAAHVIPPTGGYGANTGIADAHNLAWKLAAVLAGHAGPDLLETYDEERRPVGAYVSGQGLLQLRQRSGTSDEAQRAAVADVQTVTMGYRYASTAVLGPAAGEIAADPRLDHAEPGTRAPHVFLTVDGAVQSTLDLFGSGFTVLAASGAGHWSEAVRQVAADTGVPVRAHLVEAADGDRFAAAYRLGAGGAVLVRPDGFVAWRTDERPADAAAALRTALLRVLSRA